MASLTSYIALIDLRCRAEAAHAAYDHHSGDRGFSYDRLLLLKNVFEELIVAQRSHRSLSRRDVAV